MADKMYCTQWFAMSMIQVVASKDNASANTRHAGEASVMGCVALTSVDSSLCSWSGKAGTGLMTVNCVA